MVSINYAFREISCKIVYYGPGLSGKTTNLQYVHGRMPAKSRGDLISLATEADRTLYFDFLPIHVGDIGGFATKFQLYTVPGQVFYNATRKLVLRGVDGIVFVADSQAAKMDENIESLANMYENLRENEIDSDQIPLVFQYNKRDLPDVVSLDELEKTLNPSGRPCTEACAVDGLGVFDTMKRITKLVLEDTKRRTSAASPTPAGPSARPVVAAALAGGSTSESATAVAAAKSAIASRHGWEEKEGASVSVALSDAPVTSGPFPRRDIVASDGPAAASAPASGASPIVMAQQRSTRVRHRHRSIWDRLFGWLSGR